MCEGTKLVEVIVARSFSGDVRLEVDCREQDFSIQPGESQRIDREEDAEDCSISLFIDNESAYGDVIEDYESVTLTVNSDGEVEVDRTVT